MSNRPSKTISQPHPEVKMQRALAALSGRRGLDPETHKLIEQAEATISESSAAFSNSRARQYQPSSPSVRIKGSPTDSAETFGEGEDKINDHQSLRDRDLAMGVGMGINTPRAGVHFGEGGKPSLSASVYRKKKVG